MYVHAAMIATSGSMVIIKYAVGLPFIALKTMLPVMTKIRENATRTASSGKQNATQVKAHRSSSKYSPLQSQKRMKTPAK
ncbi:uncharacterized protein N7496_007839 [Penicillium cataractarum]|uniref:Uncharacterized protein n=1 Tax=Penicillium cataractarum TaxID=2100454 RepID=A0A9W9V554_9EURO|nr:uncharacterized protein N7496_007839 [Penicillium cataractarum]KAJ5368079.1 hypothetical protein N7496_007839 [Penicillium cataractarum]